MIRLRRTIRWLGSLGWGLFGLASEVTREAPFLVVLLMVLGLMILVIAPSPSPGSSVCP